MGRIFASDKGGASL